MNMNLGRTLASAAAETESTHWRIAPSTCGSADTFPATFASRSASVPARHSAALAVNHSGVSLPVPGFTVQGLG